MKKVRNFLLIVLCMVLVSALSIGGTIAYLTDTDGQANVMVVGNVMIEQNEQDRNGNDFVQGQYLLPVVNVTPSKDDNDYIAHNNFIDKIVTVTNTGKNDAWVRTLIAIPVQTYEGQEFQGAYDNVIHWNGYPKGYGYGVADVTDPNYNHSAASRIPGTDKHVVNEWTWANEAATNLGSYWPGNQEADWNKTIATINGKAYEVFVVTHLTTLKPGATTAPNMMGFYLDNRVDFDGTNYTLDGKKITGLDATTDILVLSQAVQSAGFDTPWVAFDTAFGTANAANISTWMSTIVIPGVISVTPANAQEMIEKAEEGSVVVLSSGYYDSLVVKTASGGSKNNIVIQGSEGTVVGCINLNSSTNITVKNITFDAAGALPSCRANGVTSYNANIIGSRTTAETSAANRGAKNIVIDNCVFDGTPTGAYASICFEERGRSTSSATDITVTNCTFNAPTTFCIRVNYAGTNGEIVVANNVFNNNNGNVFSFASTRSNITIKDNVINGWAPGATAIWVTVHSASYKLQYTVTGNTFNMDDGDPAINTGICVLRGAGCTANFSDNVFMGEFAGMNESNVPCELPN